MAGSLWWLSWVLCLKALKRYSSSFFKLYVTIRYLKLLALSLHYVYYWIPHSHTHTRVKAIITYYISLLATNGKRKFDYYLLNGTLMKRKQIRMMCVTIIVNEQKQKTLHTNKQKNWLIIFLLVLLFLPFKSLIYFYIVYFYLNIYIGRVAKQQASKGWHNEERNSFACLRKKKIKKKQILMAAQSRTLRSISEWLKLSIK